MKTNTTSSCPSSLLDLCTELVATHLDHVESFIGLPSLIGERIFSAGCHKERFKSNVDYSTQAVRLFTEAYGEEFLSSLSVSGEHLGLNYCLEQLLLFTDLVQLDLSDCGLGDDHEMLSQFQHLHRLEVLCLKGNAVTDVGIQKMTAPYRMFNRGPDRLQALDLRGNKDISKQSLKYLTKFAFLNTVLFTVACTEKLKAYGCWTMSTDGISDLQIHTEGWAKVLIDRWMKEARQKTLKTKPKPKSGAFSIRKCPVQETSSILSHSKVVGNQDSCDIVAKRLTVSRTKTDSRNTVSVNRSIEKKKNLELPEDSNIYEKDEIEDLYKVYGEIKNSAEDENTFLGKLQMCESDIRNENSANKIERTTKTAKERVKQSKLGTVKDNPFQRHNKGNNSIKKDRRSTQDLQISGRVKSIKSSVGQSTRNSKISKYFTSAQSAADDMKRDNLPVNQSMECSKNSDYGKQTNCTTVNACMAADKIGTVPKVELTKAIDPIAPKMKPKKRKRIIIKKNVDASLIFNSEDQSELNVVNEHLIIDSNEVDEKDLDKENLHKRKKFKTSLLHSLDAYF